MNRLIARAICIECKKETAREIDTNWLTNGTFKHVCYRCQVVTYHNVTEEIAA